MKFQKLLKNSKLDKFHGKFIDYKRFKKLLNANLTQEQEDNFLNKFKEDVERVFTFINNKHIEYLSKKDKLDFMDEQECDYLKDSLFMLSEFIRVNLIGIKRIIKRHDKYSGFNISDTFKDKIEEKNIQLKNITVIIKSINEKVAYQQVSHQGNKGNKYWIPSDCLVDLKLNILKHFPNKKFVKGVDKVDDSFVTSIYLDNSNLLLNSRALENPDNCTLIRFRWYGILKDIIACEMIKINRNEENITSFKVNVNYALSFLNGQNIWDQIKKLNEDKDKNAYLQISGMIKDLRLRPVLRTFYRRCIFENNERDIQINLDSNIAMIRECSNYDLEIDHFPLKYWMRTDISSEWPFRNLPACDIIRFPHAVLEVKGSGSTEEIQGILSQSSISNVQNFSKFLHGCSILYPTNDVMPKWLSQIPSKFDSDKAVQRDTLSDDLMVQIEGESSLSYNLSSASEDDRKIVIPVRVEPKAFFANERTFLSWVQFAIFLGGIGTALIGLGDMHAYLTGSMLIVLAGIFAFYSLYLFHYRANKIRAKDPGPYDTAMGPIFLVGIFILVMALSFIFKFPLKKNGLH